MSYSKTKYTVSGVIVLIALGAILFLALRGCSVNAYTVSELLSEGDSVIGEKVRVDGEVKEESINGPDDSRTIMFTLMDENEMDTVPVIYEGPMPDNFREGRGVTVEGKLSEEGEFMASKVLTKCASKYVPEE